LKQMIEEVLPGLLQWSAFHEGIGRRVHSTFALRSGTLIDPMEPPEGLAALAALATPRLVVLTNRHHYRHSDRFAAVFGCPVRCHQAGLAHFAGGHQVDGFAFDEQLTDDLRALELGAICAEETTLLLDAADGVLCFGDGLTRAGERDGALAYMPDRLLGDDPARVRAGLARSLQRMFEEDFDALLFAHAEPVLGGGRALLSEFLERAPADRERSYPEQARS
jgi:hypothetical protein